MITSSDPWPNIQQLFIEHFCLFWIIFGNFIISSSNIRIPFAPFMFKISFWLLLALFAIDLHPFASLTSFLVLKFLAYNLYSYLHNHPFSFFWLFFFFLNCDLHFCNKQELVCRWCGLEHLQMVIHIWPIDPFIPSDLDSWRLATSLKSNPNE